MSPHGSERSRLDAVVRFVEAAGIAGIDLIQIRERDVSGRELEELVTRCVRAIERSAARVVVNDRTDVALAVGAAGVHLRADSVEAARIRAFVPAAFVIGRSVHSASEAADPRDEVDYLLLGAVFQTSSKPSGHPTINLAEVARAASRSTVPVLAIGGVTPGSLTRIAGTGAAGVAAIGWFLDAARSGTDWVEGLTNAARAAREAFDSPQPLV